MTHRVMRWFRAPGAGGRSSGQRGNAHGPSVAATAFKKIAVFPVHGGMLYARKQQPVAVETAVLRVVLKQALRDLLVVRIVAEAAGGQRQLLHQGLALAIALEIRPGPGDGLRSVECDNGTNRALQQLRRAHALGAGRKLGHTGLSIADIALMKGVAVEERGGRVQQLQPLRMLEGIVEPAKGVAVFVTMLRNRE